MADVQTKSGTKKAVGIGILTLAAIAVVAFWPRKAKAATTDTTGSVPVPSGPLTPPDDEPEETPDIPKIPSYQELISDWMQWVASKVYLPSASRSNPNDPKAALSILFESGIPSNYAYAFVDAYRKIDRSTFVTNRSVGQYKNADGTYSLPAIYIVNTNGNYWERVNADEYQPAGKPYWDTVITPDGREFDTNGKEKTPWVPPADYENPFKN